MFKECQHPDNATSFWTLADIEYIESVMDYGFQKKELASIYDNFQKLANGSDLSEKEVSAILKMDLSKDYKAIGSFVSDKVQSQFLTLCLQ